MRIDEKRIDSKETMQDAIIAMNAFGSRTTGSKGHQKFIAWLKKQLNDLGLTTYSDIYMFDRWEEKKRALILQKEEIHVSSSFPYSGVTDKKGVTGELILVKRGDYKKAKGKVAVIKIDTIKKLPLNLIINQRKAFPSDTSLVSGDGDLVLTSVLKNPHLKRAKKMGVKAVILIWNGVSDEKVEDQYLPFTSEYFGIPAIWVNSTDGNKVIEAARRHEQATVILEAEKQTNAKTESFYVLVEGKNKEETILINTHTDGINVVEENGAIGMLSMIRYFQNTQPERTLVFVFVTGHFRLPEFKGTSQATSTWLMNHPELWDGKNGHKKAVAGITVEHLGSMEWKDNTKGQYMATGNIQTEYTYIGNEQMERVREKAIEGRSLLRTVTLKGHNKFQFGESQPFLEAGIPAIGLIQMPDYLMTDSVNREIEKFNVTLMRQQVKSLLKALILIDETPKDELGKSEGYSFFFGKKNK